MSSLDCAVRGLAAAVVLTGGAAVVAAVDLARSGDSPGAPGSNSANGSHAFHAVTGGLGTGPSLHLDGCSAAFDARLDGACPHDTDVVASGRVLCPLLGRGHGETESR